LFQEKVDASMDIGSKDPFLVTKNHEIVVIFNQAHGVTCGLGSTVDQIRPCHSHAKYERFVVISDENSYQLTLFLQSQILSITQSRKLSSLQSLREQDERRLRRSYDVCDIEFEDNPLDKKTVAQIAGKQVRLIRVKTPQLLFIGTVNDLCLANQRPNLIAFIYK
jgi:hypothetical protein